MRRSQSRVQYPLKTCVNDNRMDFVVSVAYDPDEFTPLVLHFTDELAPSTRVKKHL